MQHNNEVQPPQQEKEYTSDDSKARHRLHKSRRVQANAYKQRHPDATKEEIEAKYPSVVVPRKKTKWEIEASQRRKGESEEHFAKCLQNTEQKRQRRAALKLQTPTPGPSRKDRSQSQPSPVPVPPSPPIDPILLGPQPPPAPSHRIQVGPIPVPPSPPIDPVLLAPELTPPTPSCILCDSGTQTNAFTLKLPPLPGIALDNLKDGNLLQEQADAVRRHAWQSPILKDTNEYVIFMHAPFPPDAKLNDIIMDHLVHHRGVKLEGFRMPEVVEQLTAEYMATHWNVQPARVVEVHDTVCQMKTPIFPFKKMLHSEFIDGLADPGRSKKILDVPMTHRGAPPPFGLMDDGYDAWNNTSSQYDWPHGLSREQWSDMNWGLLHHATTYTDGHHDTDGKMTLIIGEHGSKLWAVTFPKGPLERQQVNTYFDQALQPTPPTETDEQLCVSFTLVLLPGDIYFQPPGAIHAIYTPEASFTLSGLYSMNLDHAPERVYEGLVRMMLSLPTNPDKLRYKRSLGAFLLMIMDPASYIPEHARAYGIAIKKNKPDKHEKGLIKQGKAEAFLSVKKYPWAYQAVEYAQRVAGFIGWFSNQEIVHFLQTGAAFSDPGEKISIAPILKEILSEQRAARKAEEDKPIKEAPVVAGKAKKRKKKLIIAYFNSYNVISSAVLPIMVCVCQKLSDMKLGRLGERQSKDDETETILRGQKRNSGADGHKRYSCALGRK
ncbi:hypothetical protein EDD18DRAFT_1362942 [Armillaria luteobubalina]|uniref:JmjC domain-containing protein n=1 Tax=Armillaria luteobubalina TaxID=153913 RepID=A0AA39PD88_9AGAR|nr:hypothetical protein EDD18DRAFT_1362942 [Armillaria luteobubalina]